MIEAYQKKYISVETLLKHFGISDEDLERKEKSAGKVEEYDFMFLEID